MRSGPAKSEAWVPHNYQRRASDHLVERGRAALFLDPGLGKTSITLDAFCRLQDAGMARKMLVVAPLRVCQLVWRQEAARWTQFNHLRIALVHGPKKAEALRQDADIYLINPEGVDWLVKRHFGRPLPFDIVTIDELTKFKNARSKRHKVLLPRLAKVPRVWGLTGTPIPNGYMDLFGQFLLLDGGQALGRYITHYRDRYFAQGFDGFTWLLRAGAAKLIEDAVAPYVLRMAAEDYLQLPELVQDVRTLELPPLKLKEYRQLKRHAILELPGGKVTAETAGSMYVKLKQMANGAVYAPDGDKRKVIPFHDVKLDALCELIEELQGQPLLVGYEFQHDLARIQERLGGDIPYLGAGVSAKRAEEIERMWNDNEIPVLLAHPASAGHGLNFQRGNASHICWYSVTIDYELYDQFLRRILRQGNKSARVIEHALVVRHTEDDHSLDTLAGKAVTQNGLLKALNAPIDQGDPEMSSVRKLSTKSSVERGERSAPKGWGARASAASEDEEDEAGEEEDAPPQRERVRSKLAGRRAAPEPEEDEAGEEEEAPPARSAFSKSVQARLAAEEEDGEDPEAEEAPPARSVRKARRPAAEVEPEEEDEPPFDGAVTSDAQPEVALSSFETPEDRAYYRRVRALELAQMFAEKVGVRTPNDAVKAAEVFEKYLKG